MLKSAEKENAAQILDSVAMKGYGCDENFERLRRCEELAQMRNCTVAQIAMAWIFRQQMNTLAVVSVTDKRQMQENIDSMHIELNLNEIQYLDLKKEIL